MKKTNSLLLLIALCLGGCATTSMKAPCRYYGRFCHQEAINVPPSIAKDIAGYQHA